ALQARGYEIDLATDTRALAYARHIPVRKIRVFAAATPHADTKWGRFCALFVLLWGTLQALWHLWRHRPKCVIGFGGYPTIPPLLAASLFRIPIILHEQNAIMGRANTFLAPWARKIATGFPLPETTPAPILRKSLHTGTPVRDAVLQAVRIPYASR